MTNSFITLNGKKALIYRGYTKNADLSSTEFLPPTKFSLGIENETPTYDAEELDMHIPIEDGTIIDNASTNLDWFMGGGLVTTNNTTIFKEGAGATDNIAQNLIVHQVGSNIWERSSVTIDPDKAFGLWVYISSSTVLDKIVYISINFGGLYFSNDDLKVGWNWLSTGNNTINENSETLYSSNITSFNINVAANSDDIDEGDIVYDLARQWAPADLKNNFVTGYPIFNELAGEVEIRCFLSNNQANGFPLNAFGLYNEDTVPKLLSLDVFNIESKSSTDEYVFIVKDRII